VMTRLVALLSGLFLLSGCAILDILATPENLAAPPTAAGSESPQRSAISAELVSYYADVQASLLSQGLLRRDDGTRDAPFTTRDLIQDFIRIALYDEYSVADGRLVARAKSSTLRRWETPIRMNVEFGPAVTDAQREVDLRNIRDYAARLSLLTGRQITFTAQDANFYVLVLNEDERLAYGPRLQSLVPGMTPSARRTIIDLPRSTFCLVHAFSDSDQASAFTAAVAVIRAEHPDLMRLSCVHEELAQGMGLANDSPRARPSIFNDDEEFALLTAHDELLLRILYDPRLRTGMREQEALPIVTEIVEGYLGQS